MRTYPLRTGLLLILALAVLPVLIWAGPGLCFQPVTPSQQGGPSVVPGQILIQVGSGVSLPETARAVGARVLRSLGGQGIHLLVLEQGSVAEAVARLRARRGVIFAEPNYLRRLQIEPDDADYGSKWDLNNDGSLGGTADADIDWQEAYTCLGASFNGSAVVAVVDTGIDAFHPDLDGKIVPGYDYLSGDNDPRDSYGHGTHVAGIALAETNNGLGTAGVGYGPNIKVMPLRVCDENGCPTSAIVEGIYHAADHGANVINLSLGGPIGSTAEQQAIDYAWGRGLVIVASSGNDGANRVSYPAIYANCIAVGATNWSDQRASYSNKGRDLDVVAPGGEMSSYHDPAGIYSTMPTYDVYLTTAYSYSRNYDQLQGTSMAAPQVSGLAALLFALGVSDSNGDGKINDEVRQLIESTADDLGAAGKDRDYGWGRINAYRAVSQAGGCGPAVNQPPVASFAYSCAGLTCEFDGSGSSDPDGTIVGYAWDFGDGASGGNQVTSHTYAAAGTYNVTLTVTDEDGAEGSQTKSVTAGETAAGVMHVADLDGSGLTVNRTKWKAQIVVTVVDGESNPVPGATVAGSFSGDGFSKNVTGVTDSSGQCTLSSGNINLSVASVTLAVTNVTLTGWTYDPTANADPDGDSDGTSIDVARP